MKDTVRRLIYLHSAVLAVVALVSALLWGGQASLASFFGALSFSLPVVVFSLKVLKASKGEQGHFWGQFMIAELFKWVSSGVLLAVAFISGFFQAIPLLGGFLLSVVVQVFFPIFVSRGSES